MEGSFLVTGGAGFIGSHIVEKLVKNGADVAIIDNFDHGSLSNINGVSKKVKVYDVDVRDNKTIESIFSKIKPKIVFHLAANASVPRSVEDPKMDFEISVMGTYNIASAAAKYGTEKIIFSSTAAVYGEPKSIPITERHPNNPVSPYGLHKLLAEKVGKTFQSMGGAAFQPLRIFNCYGPRQPRYVVHDFYQRLKEKPEKLKILGDGKQRRDFIFVEDVAGVFLTMVNEDTDKIINIGRGIGVSVREIADIMMNELEHRVDIECTGESWPGDINVLIADNTRMKKFYKSTTSIKDGLTKTIQWFKCKD